MKLYILINSSETCPGSFESQLDKKGLETADKIITKIDTNIGNIYSSPFLSSLQTIFPYCKKYNRNVNVECALYDKRCSNGIKTHINNYPSHTFGYSYILDIINPSYNSRIFPNNILMCEEEQDIINRVFPFLNKICNSECKKNVLIVTHKNILNYILYFFDRSVNLKEPIEDKFIEIIVSNHDVKPDAY
jgi:broad specificity phosphatase PhoE|tara:strand:- start:650 stop:1219 length:570 start_codon:yes stop_codon:yes gene_type:complete